MKTTEEIKVEKLVVNVKGKSLELTIDDAKRLHDEICLALGLCRPNYWPVILHQWQPAPPVYNPPGWPYPIITCGTERIDFEGANT